MRKYTFVSVLTMSGVSVCVADARLVSRAPIFSCVETFSRVTSFVRLTVFTFHNRAFLGLCLFLIVVPFLLVCNLVTCFQIIYTVATCDVNEYLVASVVWENEAKALVCPIPLYGARYLC